MSDRSNESGKVVVQLPPAMHLAGIAAISEEMRQLERSLHNGPLDHRDGFVTYHRLMVEMDERVHALLSRFRAALAEVRESGDPRSTVFAGRDLLGRLVDLLDAGLQFFHVEQVSLVAERADLACRAMRAGADRVLWERCSGGPPHERLWPLLGSVFLAARAESGEESLDRGAQRDRALIEREYSRALAAACASLETLSPTLLEAASRLLAFSAPMLQLQSSPFATATHYVDPLSADGPKRVVGRVPVEHSWFFSPRIAAAALRELSGLVERGDLPLSLVGGEPIGIQLVEALAHFEVHWAETPPARRHRRHLLEGKLSAVCGIEELQRLFSTQEHVPRQNWMMRDASRSGVGAIAPGLAVRVGELVGFRPADGAGWHLAIVRRRWTENERDQLVGMELLSRRPALVHADDGRHPVQVFACDPFLRGEAVRIVAPVDVLGPSNGPLFITQNGSIQKLKPLDATFAGEDFELRVYQVL